MDQEPRPALDASATGPDTEVRPTQHFRKYPCRDFRWGECQYGDRCAYLHQPCVRGFDCPDKNCRFGHPPDRTCPGCEKCCKGLTGAGVLLLTKANENDGPGTYDLVLVEEGREYGDMGGRVSSEELDMGEVAARELLEETAGTVNIPADVVSGAPYVDVGIFHKYRSYVVMVEAVSCRAYDAARRKPGLPRCWRETTGMFRFPLESVRRQFMERNGNLCDWIQSHSGRSYPLAGRCRSVLVDCLKTGVLDPFLLPWDGGSGDWRAKEASSETTTATSST